jgi:hypothetical protein
MCEEDLERRNLNRQREALTRTPLKMPLLPGYSRVTVSENIRELMKSGRYSREEAVRISYDKARNYWHAHGPKGTAMPAFLRPKGR